jgi:cytoskeletal protein RodZ
MSPKPRGKSSTGWKPPRDRREVLTAVLAGLTVVVITAALVWFLRPNRESTTTPTDTVATSTTAPAATTTVPGATTTAPATTSAPTTTAPTTTAPATTSSSTP